LRTATSFVGGIGEKGIKLRGKVAEGVKCLGFEIDEEKNKKPGDGVVEDITKEGSKHVILICKTDEQVSLMSAVMCAGGQG